MVKAFEERLQIKAWKTRGPWQPAKDHSCAAQTALWSSCWSCTANHWMPLAGCRSCYLCKKGGMAVLQFPAWHYWYLWLVWGGCVQLVKPEIYAASSSCKRVSAFYLFKNFLVKDNLCFLPSLTKWRSIGRGSWWTVRRLPLNTAFCETPCCAWWGEGYHCNCLR